jgi:hypothetical protein
MQMNKDTQQLMLQLKNHNVILANMLLHRWETDEVKGCIYTILDSKQNPPSFILSDLLSRILSEHAKQFQQYYKLSIQHISSDDVWLHNGSGRVL